MLGPLMNRSAILSKALKKVERFILANGSRVKLEFDQTFVDFHTTLFSKTLDHVETI